MKSVYVVLLGIFISFCLEAQNSNIPLPSQAQLRWQQYEQIMYLCLDPCTW